MNANIFEFVSKYIGEYELLHEITAITDSDQFLRYLTAKIDLKS